MPHRYPRHFNGWGAARFEGAISDLDGRMGNPLEAVLVSSRASRHDCAPMSLSGGGLKTDSVAKELRTTCGIARRQEGRYESELFARAEVGARRVTVGDG